MRQGAIGRPQPAVGRENFSAIHCHFRCDFLMISPTNERQRRYHQTGGGSIGPVTPSPLVTDNLPTLVHVDRFAKVERALIPRADCEVVARYFDQCAVIRLPFLDYARGYSANYLGFVRDSDREVHTFSIFKIQDSRFKIQDVTRFEHEIRHPAR